VSTYNIIHGVKIYTAGIASFTEDTDIGLYDTGINTPTEFRWIESYVAGTEQDWKAGIIAKNGIPPIVEGGNFSRGGGFVSVDSISIIIDNTSKFFNEIEAIGLGINGLSAEIVEFSEDTTTGVVTETVIGYFKTSINRWNVQNYTINLEPAVYNRNAQICTTIDSTSRPDSGEDDKGNSIPVTFGEFSGERFARMIRTTNVETIYNTESLIQLISDNLPDGSTIVTSLYTNTDSWTYSASVRNVFPIVKNNGTTPSLEYEIQLFDGSLNISIGGGFISSAFPVSDMYVRIISAPGGGGIVDQIRKVSTIQVPGTYDASIKIQLQNYLEEDFAANTDGSGAWVQFFLAKRNYELDHWKCGGFLDSNVSVISNPELYSYAQKSTVSISALDTKTEIVTQKNSFFRIPEYGYNLVSTAYNNSVKIDATFCDGSIDTVNSFQVAPARSILPMTTDSLAELGLTEFKLVSNGCYLDTSLPGYYVSPVSFSSDLLANESYVIDRLNSTFATIRTTFTYNTPGPVGGAGADQYAIVAIRIIPPLLESSFLFDSIGVLIDASVDHSFKQTIFGLDSIDPVITYRKFIGAHEDLITASYTPPMGELGFLEGSAIINNVPDAYYIISPDTYDKYYSVKSEFTAITDALCGVSNFNIPVSTSDDFAYKAHEVVLLVKIKYSAPFFDNTWTGSETQNIDTIIRSIAFAIKKKVSIRDFIYTTAHGRIFDSTFESRKTSADVITSPVDIYEHICRLQNWSETNPADTNPGKEYCADAKINTLTTTGGFDSLRLSSLRDIECSFQMVDPDKCWTKDLKDRLLRSMWAVGYVNENGEECIDYIPKVSSVSITDTINLSVMPLDIKIDSVEEPKPENVFCEPFIRFNYSHAEGKFKNILSIKQSHRDTFDPSYISGFSAGEAEALWQFCHDELWNRYHQIEQPPEDMTDQYFIYREEDARKFLNSWLDWMLVRRITVNVYYDFAKTWHVGRHVYLNLPHQTNGANVEAVIERIVKNRGAGICEIQLAFWVETPVNYYIQKVMYTQAQGADLPDATKIITGTPDETIQATM